MWNRLTVSRGEGDNGGKKGKGLVKEHVPMDMNNSVGIDWGFRVGCMEEGKGRGELRLL